MSLSISEKSIRSDSLALTSTEKKEKAQVLFCFKLASNERTPEVETNLDKKSVFFRARDNKKYNLKNILETRFYNACNAYQTKIDNMKWYEKILDGCKSFFNSKNSSKYLEQYSNTYAEKLYDRKNNINKLFEELTGEKFCAVNIEKFLEDKLRLKFEEMCEKFIGKEISTQNTAIPEIDGEYIKKDIDKQDIRLSKKDSIKYNELLENLDKKYKEKLKGILERGILLNNDSSSKSSTLDSLYKILTTPRSKYLNNDIILKECIDVLDNPSVITQLAEDIPEEYTEIVVDKITNNSKDKKLRQISKDNLESRHLGTCAAASIEYDIASKMPAEFINIIKQLTSSDNQFVKTLHLKKNSIEYKENLEKIKQFKTPFKETKDGIEITLKPDKDSYLLAQIQTKYKDPHERSIIDILTQSMLMNCGSRGTYNSLNDTRKCGTDGGLMDFEIGYLKNLLKEEKSEPNVYMKINRMGEVVENNINKKQKDIKMALADKENVLVGYVFLNKENKFDSGHEITIIGETQNLLGEKFFICQDSDDTIATPICIPKEELLKEIHHII